MVIIMYSYRVIDIAILEQDNVHIYLFHKILSHIIPCSLMKCENYLVYGFEYFLEVLYAFTHSNT